MTKIVVRDAAVRDTEIICALNLEEVAHTSAMDAQRLRTLAGLSRHFKVACVDGVVSAFILAMGSEAAYENDNFAWFSGKYPEFLYVDRIVVSAAFRGLRLGSLLYEDLFRYARRNAIPLVTCEYNIVPPNETSRSFHDKFGFKEQGTQWVANGSKRVSLQAAQVAAMGLRIRRASPTDGRHALEIWRRAVDATHDFLEPADRRAIEVEVTAFLPNAPLDLAIDQAGIVLGFMLLDGSHMEALFIDPAHHGKGIGRALVREGVARYPGLTTDVNAQNLHAIGFYEHLGFERIGYSPIDGQGRGYPLIHLRYPASR